MTTTAFLLREFRNDTSTLIDAPPADVFAAITDVDRLPAWNAHIPRVVERPSHPLNVNDEWVVRINALGTHWHSRARVLTLDQRAMRFEHRSCSDDGNPSYGIWTWTVTPTADGRAKLNVAWEIHPKTFWRRALFAKIRRSQLRTEVADSLAALGQKLAQKKPMILS